MNTREIIIIPATGGIRVERVEVEGDEAPLAKLQAAVVGYIEPLLVRYEGKVEQAYANEDGKRLRLPPNPRASRMALEFGRGPFVGDVVIDRPAK